MKQPLMTTPAGIPPAQAEALQDASLEGLPPLRFAASDMAAWPGEDWDDDSPSAFGASPLRRRASPAFSPARTSAHGSG